MFASRPSILRQYASKTKKTDIPQPQKPMPCCSKKDAVTRRRRFGQQGNENDSKIDVEKMCSSPIKNDEDCCYIEVFKKPSSHGTNETWSCATWSSGDDSSGLASSSSSSVYELVSCSSSAYEVASDDEEVTLPEEGPIIFGFRLCEYLDDDEEERSVSLADDHGDDSRNGEALGKKKKKKKKSRRCCRIPRRASDTSFDSITLADCPRVARKQL